MLYSDTPLLYASIIIVSVTVFQFMFARLKIRSNFFEKFVDSRPNMFVKEGEILYDALEAESYTVKELESDLRQAGVRDIGEVQYAYLELNGNVSVFQYPEGERKQIQQIIPVPEVDGLMKV
jgi:uncharacterized membrane protein YcaP (DUF421 family)